MTAADPLLDDSRVLVVGTDEWLDSVAATLENRAAAVESVETTAEALAAFARTPIDCLLTEYALEERTGIDLLEEIREETTALPVVVGASEGSEAIASEAVRAGADDYVAIDRAVEQTTDEVLDRLEDALGSAQRTVSRRERARQFHAVFHDTQTATWVLEPDGRLARANETAREMVDEAVDTVVGEPFWTLPWWQGEATGADLRQLVETATDGTFGNAVVTLPPGVEQPRVIDLSVRPVENEAGDLVSIVVEGLDITERVELERDLRQSETLHRVTLNNMTDTVLITNDEGEYTYVCPNVHFIFGYTADEIRDQRPIEDLLGDDLFDREELATAGVLKNIECTATDKAGREHTLLVNVREVSIQDGTVLYSCRDITKRKQREEALATLQETARDFLYAETHQEIAQHVVDDVPGVLDTDASAVYRFDADANALRPAARGGSMPELHGPLPTLPVDGETLPSYSFLEDETLCFDDVHESDRLDNRATELRSAIYIPLGDHGVFIAGSDQVGVFDAVAREPADLLAATAEAALDRVTRESQLREQDRRLQRRNEQLTTLNRINETIREIDRTIVQAETKDEIDHAVCERLTDHDRFSFVWIGSVDPATETVEPRAWAGDEQGYLDGQSFPVASSGTEPAGQTAATGEPTIVTNVAEDLRDDPWRTTALTREFTSVLSVPLVYNDLSHGVLTVYADSRDAFDDTARAVLAELGETVASARSAIERKNALLTTSTTRVEFAIDDPTFVLSRLATRAECTIRYQGGIQQPSEGPFVFVTVEDAGGETVADAAVDTPVDTRSAEPTTDTPPVEAAADAAAEMTAIDDVEQIRASETDGVLRLALARPFLAQELADHGVVVREATADPTTTTLVVDVPETIAVRGITKLVGETVSSVELRTRRTLDRAVERDHAATLLEKLTDRQLEVVGTAYYSGFFESPRESNGEDLAETLGISPPAFYQHVRTVQRKLFTTVFEESATPIGTADGFNN